MKLDRTDRALLRALQNNARLTNKELAGRVALAPSTCLERVRRLEQAGVLQGYHAQVEAGALGIGLQAIIAVQLQPNSRDHIDAFQRHADQLPEVQASYHVSGAHDFLVHVAVRDAAHLRDLTLDQFSSRPEVFHIETALIFHHSRRMELPDYLT